MTPSESDVKDLAKELNQQVSGEVRFDKMSRLLYSTDASIYQIEPTGVVIPRSDEDVIAVIEIANKYNVPVLPRGGGTSLAGQTVAPAVVIDFSKYMREILEINTDEGWVRAQPGIILDELNHFLSPHNHFFTPDPSTSNRSNVGGALGNNSCGAHSIVWGKTIDNVYEVNAILSNGQKILLNQVDSYQLSNKASISGLEGEIYRTLSSVGDSEKSEVLNRFPKIQRRVSGYNLDELISKKGVDMARFVVGSEGTLLTITEAKLKIVPRPKFKGLAVLHFHDLVRSLEATVSVLETNPSAIEMIGRLIIDQARKSPGYSHLTGFIEGDPEALLVVEYTGSSHKEIESKLDKVESEMKKQSLTYAVTRLTEPSDQENVWAVRKAGLGLMMNVPGAARPLPFVEDTAVAPEKLPEFVRRFDQIVKDHDTSAGYYGHASVGCLHIRPLIDLKTEDGVKRMESIASSICDLVLEFNGSMSGEHGDGLARSTWNKKMFGPQLYDAFRKIKYAFDPKGIMNPGKIVDAQSMTENLRIDPTYKPTDLISSFGYSREGSFAAAVEMCNGQGACRKVIGGTMCPSYMATRDEEHSTRGRANALRAVTSGSIPINELTGKRLHQVMELCIECKACKVECPSNVDMAKLKYEYLYKYHQTNGLTRRNNVFGNIATLNRLGSFFAPVSNWMMKTDVIKDLMQDLVGIDSRRTLPDFSSQTFRQWHRARTRSQQSTKHAKNIVVLFPDTFTNYNYPQIGIAAIKVLEALNYEVVIPPSKCCGRPMLSSGMLDRARENALYNVKLVLPYLRSGAKLVGLEPSCILSFRDDYVDLLNDEHVDLVAENTMLIEEFILYAIKKGASLEFKNPPRDVLVHGHCHQKALVGMKDIMNVLDMVLGCEANEIPSGCCGMAGSFGFEKEHYDISMQMGEQVLFPTIRDSDSETILISEGISCRQQINDGTGRKAMHLAEVLASAL